MIKTKAVILTQTLWFNTELSDGDIAEEVARVLESQASWCRDNPVRCHQWLLGLPAADPAELIPARP